MRPFQFKYWYFIYINVHILLVSFLDFYRIWAAKLAPGSSYCHLHTHKGVWESEKEKKENKKIPHSWEQLNFLETFVQFGLTEAVHDWSSLLSFYKSGKLSLPRSDARPPALGRQRAQRAAQPLWDSQVTRDITACPDCQAVQRLLVRCAVSAVIKKAGLGKSGWVMMTTSLSSFKYQQLFFFFLFYIWS